MLKDISVGSTIETLMDHATRYDTGGQSGLEYETDLASWFGVINPCIKPYWPSCRNQWFAGVSKTCNESISYHKAANV